jgi:hypothetical protein
LDVLVGAGLVVSTAVAVGGPAVISGTTTLGIGTVALNPFVHGALFETSVATAAGEAGVIAEVEISGSQLTLNSLSIFGKSGELVNQIGQGAFLAARTQLARQAAAAGFTTLRIIAERSAASSSALPGKPIDITINLSRYR